MINWLKSKLKWLLVATGVISLVLAADVNNTERITVVGDRATLEKTEFVVEKINSDEIAIPDEAVGIKISASRGAIPAIEGDSIKVTAEILNEKKEVIKRFGFGAIGGDFVKRDGTISTESTVTSGLPREINRTIRITVDSKVNMQSLINLDFIRQ